MARKRQSGGLVAAVIESMPPRVHGSLPWYERVAPEHREELDELKAMWRAGRLRDKSGQALPKNTAARLISMKLNEGGISNVGTQGVNEWLGKA